MPVSIPVVRHCRFLLLLAGWLVAAHAPPTPAQELFRARQYRVRVALAEKVSRVAVVGRQDYQILSDSMATIGQIRAGQPYFLDILEGQPGEKIYRLVAREFAPRQVDQAVDLARQAKDSHQLPVKVFRIPSREPGGGRILVTLGEFASLEEARARIARLDSMQISLIYEDRAIAVKGQVRLFDRNGTILARDGRRLRLAPTRPGSGDLAVKTIDDGQWSAAELSSARRYRGDLDLMLDEAGMLTAVNDVLVEDYLYSVVGAEIGTDSPIEAMKAQAVAGRSEAVAKIERRIVSSTMFDFYDTAIAQAYPGRSKESARVREAVDATRGQILVWRGKAVDAVYSHSCGGFIASSEDVWNGAGDGSSRRHADRLAVDETPSLERWRDAYRFLKADAPALCNPNQRGFPGYARKYYRWEKSFTGAEFSELADRLYRTGRVKDVYIDDRAASGRVRKMRIIGVNRTVTITQELEIRQALGSIYSTFFALAKEQDNAGMLKSLLIHGGGYGHGVGMCQMGALTMARRGYTYRQILAHYYQEVEIRYLYR
jgi:peptidoglycan hydrolase-like amidase